jgi:predicted MFS family arabinose efflux permease
MSQNKLDNGSAGAVPLRIALQPAAAPANDTDWSPSGTQLGPLGLSRTYWMLWGGMLLNRLGGTIFLLLGLYLTRERGLSPELAGLVISLYAAGGLFAGPIGGVSADRLGRRPTLLVGTAGSGAFMLGLGFARSTAAIVAIAPVLGFFTDACRAPLQAAVADVVPPRDRARAYGLLYWAINLGFAAAASFGGALAAHHFGLLFVIDALTTFGYGAFVLLGVPETRPPPVFAGGSAGTVAPAGLLDLPLRDAPFVKFVVIQLLLLLAFVQVLVTLPLDMQAHGLGMAQIGWLLGLNGVFIVIGQPIALRILRRFGHLHWLVAGALLTGLGLGTNAFARQGSPLVYLAAVALWTAGEIGVSSAAPALVADFAPADRRGVYQGTYQLAWAIAFTVAPTLGSLVLARLGAPALWLGCLVVCLAAAALHLEITARRQPV